MRLHGNCRNHGELKENASGYSNCGDSSESFQTQKNAIVGMEFEYRLIPMAEGQVISDHGGGGDRRVQ